MKTNIETARYIFNSLKIKGIDQIQCTLSTDKIDEYVVMGGSFNVLKTLYDQSITIKIINEKKYAEVFINSFDPEIIEDGINSCLSIIQYSTQEDNYRFPDKKSIQKFNSCISTLDLDKLFKRINEFIMDIKTDFPLIIVESLIASYIYSEELLINTNGIQYEHISGEYNFNFSIASHYKKQYSSRNEYAFSTSTLESKLIDSSIMNRLILEDCQNQIDALVLEKNTIGKVIFSPTCLPDLVMHILNLTVTDDVIINSTSPWLNLLGKKVAYDFFTLKTVPLDSRIVCGERYSNEGYISNNETIINNGILSSFILSDYAACKTGFKRAKNTSWNIEILPGIKTIQEIIKDVDYGLIVNRFSGGVPSINGDFSGIAKNSFLIVDGKIKNSVTETMINGNLFELLNNIIDISNDIIENGSHICPWILFDKIVISSK
ncbi:MAG: metallopeptidase TldD-related protein [Clostridium sp.]